MSKDRTWNSATIWTFPTEAEIRIERVFDAPRELVFRAYTDPALIPRWWGPGRLTTTVDKMDVRPGGVWRFVQHDADGNEYVFHGEYREVVPPARLVNTFEYEAEPGHVSVDTMVLEDLNGKTKMTITSLFDSKQDRDGMMQEGAEEGANESYDRLDHLLAELPKTSV